MKPKRLYYRRKDKSIVIEGKDKDAKSVLIWTLPDAETFINQLLEKASYFPVEKAEKIKEKLKRLAVKEINTSKPSPNIPLIIINRSPENDAETELTEEEINKSLEESKEKGII